MKRKASEILADLNSRNSIHGKVNNYAVRQAQKALCEDLLAGSPEKNDWENRKDPTDHREHYANGFNTAITQMEQAIRSYFGEE